MIHISSYGVQVLCTCPPELFLIVLVVSEPFGISTDRFSTKAIVAKFWSQHDTEYDMIFVTRTCSILLSNPRIKRILLFLICLNIYALCWLHLNELYFWTEWIRWYSTCDKNIGNYIGKLCLSLHDAYFNLILTLAYFITATFCFYWLCTVSENKYSLICSTFTGTLNQLHFILFIHLSSHFIFQFLHVVLWSTLACLLADACIESLKSYWWTWGTSSLCISRSPTPLSHTNNNTCWILTLGLWA